MPYCSISFWFDVNSMTFWFRIVSLYLSKCVIYRQRTLLNSLTNNWVKVLLCWWYDLPILCCFFTLQNCIVPSMCFLTYWCQLFQCCLHIFSRLLAHMHPPEIFFPCECTHALVTGHIRLFTLCMFCWVFSSVSHIGFIGLEHFAETIFQFGSISHLWSTFSW